MKKVIYFMTGLLCLTLVTGCEKQEAKNACKEEVAKIYAEANDPSIVRCIADYKLETKKVIYSFCINDKQTIYERFGNAYKVGDLFYDMKLNFYNQISKEVTDGYEGYYAFEFKPSELK